MSREKGKVTTSVLYIVFAFYVCFVVWNILFKYCAPWQILDSGREVYRSVNLIPFDQIIHSRGFGDLNLYGNILLFIPFGVYLQIFMKDKGVWKGVLAGAAASVILEVLQLVLGLGATDIDDVILNTVGAFAGILGYRLLFSIFRKNESYVRTFIAWGSAVTCAGVLVLVILLVVYN